MPYYTDLCPSQTSSEKVLSAVDGDFFIIFHFIKSQIQTLEKFHDKTTLKIFSLDVSLIKNFKSHKITIETLAYTIGIWKIGPSSVSSQGK